MSDVQLLFVVLGGLYLWECAGWLRRGGIAFTSWTGRRWRMQHPGVMLGNQRGGFVFAAPLPPLGTLHTGYQWPFSLGPDGVLFFVSASVNSGWRASQSGRFLSWAELSGLSVTGKKLRLNREAIFAAATPTLAQHLHHILSHIPKLNPGERAVAIEKMLSASFDTKQIEKLLHELQSNTQLVRVLANVLFVLVFAIAPALIWFIGLKLVWIGVLAGILTLTITMAVRFRQIHAKFYPAAADDRFTQTLIIALAPASTMRAHDLLSRALLENFHPLAVAKVLLPLETFRRFARRFLLDLRHPALPGCSNPQPQALATEIFFRRTLLEIVAGWLNEQKIPSDELCRPPAPADDSCRAYCPRCEAQFTSASGFCADCGGLSLQPFPKVS
jgi:hypothetical protein